MHQKLATCLVMCLAFSGIAAAQTNVEINAGLQLNLSQPGARSLGLGGAFIGLADDSTAAYTNPAGLANLSVSEVSVEGRAWDFTTSFTDDGFIVNEDGILDDSGLIEGESESSTSGASFAALAFPAKKWVFALYYHQLANYEASFETRGAGGLGLGSIFLFPANSNTLLEIEGTGLAAAIRLSDAFSLGFGVISYQAIWEASTRRFRDTRDRSQDRWLNQQEIQSDDEAVTGSLGFEWKLAEGWRVGGVYRRGPEFDFTTANTLGPASGFNGVTFFENEGVLRVPDVYGVGLSYAGTSFRVLMDWVRVEYSSLTEETVDAFTDDPLTNLPASRLVVDDVDEYHLGFEYVFVNMKNPLAIRLGAWLDPDHEIRYEGLVETPSELAAALLFRAGEDEVHYTGGFGLVFADGRFEMNVAVDLSERVNTASASLVVRGF